MLRVTWARKERALRPPGEGPEWTTWSTLDERAVVGRDAAASDVVIDDPRISRRHLAIERVGEHLTVADSHSTGGSWINGHRLTGRERVAPTDRVEIGGHVVHVDHGLPPMLDFGGDTTERGDVRRDLALVRSEPEPFEPRSERTAAGARLWREGRRGDEPALCLWGAVCARPGPLAWHAIVTCLDRWPASSGSPGWVARDALLSELDRLLATWPAEVRRGPARWWNQLRGGLPEPRWTLVRVWQLERPDETDVRALVDSPGRLQSLAIEHWHPDPEPLARVLDADALLDLRTLALRGCRIGPSLGALLDSALASRLDRLVLEHCDLDDDAIRHVARAPAFQGSRLRELSLRGNRVTDAGAAILGRSPCLTGLALLDLRGAALTQQGVMALRTSRRLEGAVLRY